MSLYCGLVFLKHYVIIYYVAVTRLHVHGACNHKTVKWIFTHRGTSNIE